MNIEQVLAEALVVKQNMDELTLLGDKLYICMDCKQISSYWEPGGVCQACEAEAERQQEMRHEN